jgi:two-component system, LytTR family, response regulator
MKVWTSVIVDDERLARVALKRLLDPYDDIVVAGEANSCASAAKLIDQINPTLLFLDVQLIDESGFDLLPMIRQDPFPHILFVTAHDTYAVRAFEVNALDYLLKPINPDRLSQAIWKLRDGPFHDRSENIYRYSDTLFLNTDFKTSRFVKIASILTITPVGNHSEVTSVDGTRCIVLKTLKQWEHELPGDHFIRIHKSTIVNREHVERIVKVSGSHHELYLKSIPEPLSISRRSMQQLRDLKRSI